MGYTLRGEHPGGPGEIEGRETGMSRCGSCDLYWPNGKNNFGVTCGGNCSAEECADNLQTLVIELRKELQKRGGKNRNDSGNCW